MEKKIYGKIAIVVIPLAAALFALLPTFRYRAVKGEVEDLTQKVRQSETDNPKLDTLLAQKEDEMRERQSKNIIKFGLDLEGGMYLTMEVDVLQLIQEMAVPGKKEAPEFVAIIDKTKNDLKLNPDASTIDVFYNNFKNYDWPASEGNVTLADFYEFGNFKMTEKDILDRIREEADEAVNRAKEVIQRRIDRYGLAEATIVTQGTRRIVVELPGVRDREQMMDLLKKTARLEFKLVKSNIALVQAFYKIDNALKAKYENQDYYGENDALAAADTSIADTTASDTTLAAEATLDDSLAVTEPSETMSDSARYAGLSDEEKLKQYRKDHPLTSLFTSVVIDTTTGQSNMFDYSEQNYPFWNGVRYQFTIHTDQIPEFERLMNDPTVQSLMPKGLYIALMADPVQTGSPEQQGNFYNFLGLEKEPLLTGEVLTDAYATTDPSTGRAEVHMEMNSEGADEWDKITAANVGNQVAIVLDSVIYSAPNIITRISNGSSRITGMGGPEEARLLEIVLKAGALKAPVKILEEKTVGPSLGEDSIRAGLTASLIAFLLVILYMAVYYSAGGLVADFAVMLNVLLIAAVLSAFGGTLTLPGIAGVILTIGMAVDANILIFERIREEIFKGRSLRSSVDEGFSKALSAIIDTNITTGITALILYFLGSGPIQGFALTLLIGIFGTLFTGIMVSRALIEIILRAGASRVSFGEPKSAIQQA